MSKKEPKHKQQASQSKLKQTEKALIKSESWYRTLLNTIPDLVWLKDLDGVYLSCNSIFERFFGAKESEILGKTDYDFVDKELADFFRKHDRKVMETKQQSVNEEWLTFADNGYHGLFETVKSPMYNSDGELIGVLGIARDITERKKIESLLKQNEARYKSAQSIGKVGNWEYDLATGNFWGSDQARLIYGFDLESDYFTTDEVENCIPEREKVHQALVDLIKQNKPYNLEFEIHPVTGPKSRIIRSIADITRDEAGKPVKIVGVIQDITDQKKAEEERKNLEEQLRQVQKMEAIGRLAGGVAHDFNNMLSVILGNSEIIMEDMDSTSPLLSNQEEIYKAAKRSADLTRQLLAFARKQAIKPKVLNLNEALEDMLRILRRLMGEDIELKWLPANELKAVKIDPSQFDQLLTNLCVNARDAIRGVGKVSIETKNVVFNDDYCRDHTGFKPGCFVMIAISDTGSGMDKNTQKNLFEPFFTSKRVGHGGGLGLATVYGIVKQNKGVINVYSEVGKGSTFKIYFPAHSADSTNQHNSHGKEPLLPKGSETILLVEDEKALLKMTKILINKLGYNVITASSPTKAIQIAKKNKLDTIHLLLTDVVMPEMNGLELSEKIKQLHPNMKCLYMSGYTANIIGRHDVLDKEIQFLGKPFSKEELAIKLRETLSSSKKY